MLMGSSSAGKTSIMNELETKYGWHALSGDVMMEQDRDTRIAKYKQELKESAVMQKLLAYMPENAVIEMCFNGNLKITNPTGKILEHHFNHPDYPDLENILRQAQFPENIISELVAHLHELGNFFKNHKLPFIDVPQMLIDRALSGEFKASDTVILDIVPQIDRDGNALPITKQANNFNTCISQYKNAHPDSPITSHVVLAYCPPQVLSERILGRNQKAEERHDDKDKRNGLFPFNQLTALVTTDPSSSPKTAFGAISLQELFKIAHNHPNPQPHNATALEKSTKFEAEASATVSLASRFGFFSRNRAPQDQSIPLALKDGLRFDAIINTATGDAATLAKQLVAELESTPQAYTNTMLQLHTP
jgi:hypothetical protein